MVIEKALAIHSSESEKAVLGSILLDETCFELVKDFIPEKDVFYELKNQSVWEVICKLKKENIPVDLINVSTKLDNMTYYVSGLVDSTPTAANAISYARQLNSDWLRRKLVAQSQQIAEKATDNAMLRSNPDLEKYNMKYENNFFIPIDYKKLLEKEG